MLSADQFLGVIEKQDPRLAMKLATIPSDYTGSGATSVIFDGETAKSQNIYRSIDPELAANDRVVMGQVGHTYVILGTLDQTSHAHPYSPTSHGHDFIAAAGTRAASKGPDQYPLGFTVYGATAADAYPFVNAEVVTDKSSSIRAKQTCTEIATGHQATRALSSETAWGAWRLVTANSNSWYHTYDTLGGPGTVFLVGPTMPFKKLLGAGLTKLRWTVSLSAFVNTTGTVYTDVHRLVSTDYLFVNRFYWNQASVHHTFSGGGNGWETLGPGTYDFRLRLNSAGPTITFDLNDYSFVTVEEVPV